MSNYTPSTFSIRKQTDRQLLQALRRAFEASTIEPENLVLIPLVGGVPLTAPLGKAEEAPGVQQYLEAGAMLFRSIAVPFCASKASIRITRTDGSATDSCTVELGSLNNQPQQPKPDPLALSLLAAQLQLELGAVDSADLKKVLGEDAAKHYEYRENEMSKLQATLIEVSKRFTEGAAQHAQSLREEFTKDREALATEFEQKKAKEAERVQAQDDELAQREQRLADRLKEVDDKEAKHARRKIRQDLQAELAKRSESFELTKGTKKLRGPITFAVYLVLLVSSGIGALLVHQTANNPGLLSHPVNILRHLATGLTFAGTLIFYLRWQNRWFEQHAQEEFRLKRMALDIDRASWVVEMAMEWKEEKDTELPKDLLDRLSANLFEESGRKEEALHPADQLASALLGTSAGAKIKLPDGSELTLDRKSLRQLAKDGDAAK